MPVDAKPLFRPDVLRPHLATFRLSERAKGERLANRPKRMRRVATRYEKLGCAFLAMVHVACVASILL